MKDLQNEMTSADLDSIMKKAKKYEKLEQAWLDGIKDKDYTTVEFLRVCKEVIEDFKIDKRTRMR